MSAAQPHLSYIPQDLFLSDVQAIARQVETGDWRPDFIVGIGRGGLVPATYLSHQLGIPMLSVDHSSRMPDFADDLLAKLAIKSGTGHRLLFVDDINDSGSTIDYFRTTLAREGANDAHIRFAVIIDNSRSRARVDYSARRINRDVDKDWFVFPWEAVATRRTLIEEATAVPERLA